MFTVAWEHKGYKFQSLWHSSTLEHVSYHRRCCLLHLYLEFLSSNGLHVALFADGELVGDFSVRGVDLSPGEVVTFLGDLGDQLVVTALLDDVIGDTWTQVDDGCEDNRDSAGWTHVLCPWNILDSPSNSPSTLQKASYPSWVSVSHRPAKAIFAVVGGLRFASREAGGKLREMQGAGRKTAAVYIPYNPPYLHVMSPERNYNWRWWSSSYNSSNERAITLKWMKVYYAPR